MKKNLLFFAVVMMLIPFTVYSSDMMGKEIRTIEKNGYKLVYTLIDMEQKAADAGLDNDMTNMFHLMVHAEENNIAVKGAKAGFMVTAPDKSVVKVMAMEMSGGYGADLIFDEKGDYEIKIKIKTKNSTISDSFIYKVK